MSHEGFALQLRRACKVSPGRWPCSCSFSRDGHLPRNRRSTICRATCGHILEHAPNSLGQLRRGGR
eukprot:11593781-Alexandrium_andersonii.AAC.1